MFNPFSTSSRVRRRRAASHRPMQLEPMEGRELLSGVPFVTTSGTRVVEGTGSNSTMVFTIKLSGASTSPVSLNFQTSDLTAHAGSDYVATSGTLTFAPGETTKTVPVTVIGDSIIENSEMFSLKLANPQSCSLTSTQAIGTILDDDTPVASQLSIGDVQMKRGLGGTKIMSFTLSLNAAATSPVSVRATTSDLTALAGRDYQSKSAVLTFAPGERTKQFDVTINGTATLTPDVIFLVKLTDAGIPVARGTGAGILKYGA